MDPTLTHIPPQVLDATRIVSYASCPRRFFYEHCNHIRSTTSAMSLIFGGAFASGLEKYRTARHGGTPHAEALDLSHERILWKWGDFQFEADKPTDPRSLLRCHHTLEAYLLEFPWETDRLRPHPSPTGGFEFSFALPLDRSLGRDFPLHPSGDPYIYCGRIDALGLYDDVPVHCDEKSTIMLKSDWAQQWTYRRQFIGYNWALQKLGHGPHYTLVRGIVVHKDDFLFPEAGPIRVSSATLQAFEDDLLDTVWDIHQGYLCGRWPRCWGNACQSFNRPCPFLDVCFTAPHIGGAFLATMPRNEWKPQEMER